MNRIELIDKIQSKEDKVVKYVYQMKSDGVISEVSYIDNNTNKDIICCSTHSGCQCGCRFCFLTDFSNKIKTRPLTSMEIFETISETYKNQNLPNENRILLVSFMGCGEPLENDYLSSSMLEIKKKFKPCRFAVATLIPRHNWMKFFFLVEDIYFGELIKKTQLLLRTVMQVRKIVC